MNPIACYTPDYVRRLRQHTTACVCAGCRCHPPLVTLRWQTQIRHSARLGCDRAALAILSRDDAFVLHGSDAPAAQAPPFDGRQQALNQAAINLAIAGDSPPEVILYTLGILLSKGHRLAGPQQIAALGDELVTLMIRGDMAQALGRLPLIERGKLAALRALSRSGLEASLDPLTGMTLALKLNEINVLNPRYLQERLNALEQDPALPAWMHTHRSYFINLLLYAFYHHAFPGAEQARWEQQFHHLCQYFFSIKMLCGLFMQSALTLDSTAFAALAAGLARMPLPADSENPLLAGLSLLR